jgi:hypothetical protein
MAVNRLVGRLRTLNRADHDPASSHRVIPE